MTNADRSIHSIAGDLGAYRPVDSATYSRLGRLKRLHDTHGPVGAVLAKPGDELRDTLDGDRHRAIRRLFGRQEIADLERP